jgi:hypothetical protein
MPHHLSEVDIDPNEKVDDRSSFNAAIFIELLDLLPLPLPR